MLKEIKGMYYGASITGVEGGSSTTSLQLVVHRNNTDYILSEIDAAGAVVHDRDFRAQKLDLKDLVKGGVRVYPNMFSHPDIKPGQSYEFNIGSKRVKILGTNRRGISFNENPATPWSKQLEVTMYP